MYSGCLAITIAALLLLLLVLSAADLNVPSPLHTLRLPLSFTSNNFECVLTMPGLQAQMLFTT